MHHKHSFGEYSKTDIICKRGSSVRNTAWYCRELQFAIREKTTQSTVNGSQAAWVNFSADSGAAPISPAVFSTCHKIEVTFPLPQLPMQSRWRNSNTFKHNPEWPLLRRVHYTGIQYSRATLQWCIGMLQNYSNIMGEENCSDQHAKQIAAGGSLWAWAGFSAESATPAASACNRRCYSTSTVHYTATHFGVHGRWRNSTKLTMASDLKVHREYTPE